MQSGHFTPTELENTVQQCVSALSKSGAMDRIRRSVEELLKPSEQARQDAIAQSAAQFLQHRPSTVTKPAVVFAETQAAVLGSEVANALQRQIDNLSQKGSAKWLHDLFHSEMNKIHPDSSPHPALPDAQDAKIQPLAPSPTHSPDKPHPIADTTPASAAPCRKPPPQTASEKTKSQSTPDKEAPNTHTEPPQRAASPPPHPPVAVPNNDFRVPSPVVHSKDTESAATKRSLAQPVPKPRMESDSTKPVQPKPTAKPATCDADIAQAPDCGPSRPEQPSAKSGPQTPAKRPAADAEKECHQSPKPHVPRTPSPRPAIPSTPQQCEKTKRQTRDTSDSTSVRSVQNTSPVRCTISLTRTAKAGALNKGAQQKRRHVPQTSAPEIARAIGGETSMTRGGVDESPQPLDRAENATDQPDVKKECQDAAPRRKESLADTVRSQSSVRSSDGCAHVSEKHAAETRGAGDVEVTADVKPTPSKRGRKKRNKITRDEKRRRKKLKKEQAKALALVKATGAKPSKKIADVDTVVERVESGDVLGTKRSEESIEKCPREVHYRPGVLKHFDKRKLVKPEDYAAQQKILKCLRQLMKQDFAAPFLQPVDPEWEGCETYLEEIENPMDLGTISERLESSSPESGVYKSVAAVMRDINLVWSNCKQYNGELDPVSCAATQCVSYLDIMLESTEAKQDESKRVRRRNSNRTVLPKRKIEPDSHADSKKRKRAKAHAVPASKEPIRPVENVNDGRLLGKRLLIFAAVNRQVKDWHKTKAIAFDTPSSSYTVEFTELNFTDSQATFGRDEVGGKEPKYAIFKVIGNM